MTAISSKAISALVALPTSPAATFEYSNAVLEQLLTGANGAELPAAPLQRIALPPPHDLALPQEGFCPVPPEVVELPKVVREYPMPGARETHEMAVVGDNMLLVSQQTNSTLVKVQLNPITGRPLACARFLLHDFWAGLHGLAASQAHKGHVWATLQFKSLLVRIDVGADLASPPNVEQVISLPPPANGPHCILECGQDLWTSCKDSSHVVRINHTDPTDYSVYPCSRRPIFMAMHPTSMDVYASLDLSSKILRLEPSTGETAEIDISPTKGSTPVGLVQGPDGNVWFTLVGGAAGGTGTFARIFATGEFQWFSLSTSIGTKAGLLHLAFDWDYHLNQQASNNNEDGSSSLYVRLWLLSSSLVADKGNGIDAIFTVVIDCGLGRIINEHSIVLPTQLCATHRVLPHRTGLFVTQLKVSSLAHIAGTAVLKPMEVAGETTDFYSDFGLGQGLSHYMFSEERASRGALLGPLAPAIQFARSTTRRLKPNSSGGRWTKRQRINTTTSST